MSRLPPNAIAPGSTAAPRAPFLPPEGLPGEPKAEAPPAKPKAEIAALRFLDPDAVSKTIPLKYPFAYDGGDGEIEVSEVTIRRLSVAEVAEIVNARRGESDIDLFPFYAAMTGLPAAVLRAIPDDEEVIAACVPFLPAAARELLELLISVFGAGSPSQRPAPAENLSPAS